MIKTILLLTPVYVTFFWSILLNFRSGEESFAQRFLGKFMLACVVVYFTHFLYFSHIDSLLRLVEPFYNLASLSVYPLFYVYFRLLLVEKSFKWSKHGIYFLLPVMLFLLYMGTVLSLPAPIFLRWLYRSNPLPDLFALHLLNALLPIMALVNVAQIIFTVTANLRLINSHRIKARNFVADLNEIQSQKVVTLNIVLVVCGSSSIVLSLLGRSFFISEMTGITLASIVFSSMLFAIGWLGYGQPSVNRYSDETIASTNDSSEELLLDHRQQLMNKIIHQFKVEQCHLNNKLSIQDVAQAVGTNRTYVSSIINQHYGVNFCTFVNNFRMEALEKMLREHPELTNQLLAENCGFGSVDSLKRAVNAKTGLSVSQWKARLTNTKR